MAATNPATQSVAPSSPSVNPNYTPASLYVGDLKPEVSEALLFDVFNNVGPVASIRVCRDVVTRRSLGYAYVNFHSVQDAERAVDTMNFSSIRGHPCRIMWSQRDPSLRKSGIGNTFVKNLDRTIDHKTLYDTFSMFGNILSCKVASNERGESLGYGFVHYETLASATKAIEKVDGMVIAGRQVQVAPFLPKSQRNPTNAASFTNVYVKGLPADIDEEKFMAIFEKYGKITSTKLPVDETGKPKGFGFVNFLNAEDAANAVLGENSPETGFYCARAQKKEERDRLLRAKFESMRIQQAEKYAGVNLYIKNLDDSVDDVQLENEFKEFGAITSAKVMKDVNGRSKGFGFVCFTDKEEAAKAVSDMNGKVMCGKPLYVTLAQRKEVRRQQLEAQAQVNRNKLTTGMPPQMYPNAAMFYQQPTGPGQLPRPAPGYVYPQQMMPQRWNPATQGRSPQLIAMAPRGQTGPMSGVYLNNLMQQQYQQQQQQQQGRGVGQQQGQHQQQQGQQGGPMPGQQQQQGRGGGRGPGGPQQAGQRQSVMKPTGQVPPRQQAGVPQQAGGGQQVQQQAGGQPMPNQQNRIKYENNVRNQGQPQQGGAAVVNGVNPVVADAQVAQQQQQGGGGADGGAGGAGAPSGPPGPLTSQALARAPTQQQKQMIGERIFPLIKERQPKLGGKITGMLLEMDNTELLHLLENREALDGKIAEAMSVLQQHDDASTNKPAEPQQQQAQQPQQADAN